jgi:hypothetical protein
MNTGSFSTQSKTFFTHLAGRVRNENIVSDIFYSLLTTSLEFREIINCIFKKNTANLEINLCSNGVYFEREYYTMTGVRPDLRISGATEKPIIVEFKLFDYNYHFDDYSELLKTDGHAHIFLITAHEVKEKLPPFWTVLYWKNIVDILDQSGDELILAITSYFRSVTLSEKLEAVRFENPRAMLYLNRLLKFTIANWASNNNYKAEYKIRSDSFGEKWSGYHYELKNDQKIIAECYFGLFYGDDSKPECLYLGVLKQSLKDRCNIVEEQLHKRFTKLFKINKDDKEISVHMASNDYRQFIKCTNEMMATELLNTQKALLNNFFDEFNNELLNILC